MGIWMYVARFLFAAFIGCTVGALDWAHQWRAANAAVAAKNEKRAKKGKEPKESVMTPLPPILLAVATSVVATAATYAHVAVAWRIATIVAMAAFVALVIFGTVRRTDEALVLLTGVTLVALLSPVFDGQALAWDPIWSTIVAGFWLATLLVSIFVSFGDKLPEEGDAHVGPFGWAATAFAVATLAVVVVGLVLRLTA